MITIAALAAVLVAGIFATTPMAAYAGGDYDGDSSETKTKQEIKRFSGIYNDVRITEV